MTNTLYITFDGITDPLGRSQILPYLTGISSAGYRITLLSCEKKGRKDERNEVQKKLDAQGIDWHIIEYEESGGFFSRFDYVRLLSARALELYATRKFGLVHCRSYLPALIGLKMKRSLQVPFLFDMRGLWADERMDGGIWKKDNMLHRMAYHYFKKKEKQFLKHCDALVSLTQAGLEHLSGVFPEFDLKAKAKVIPCCADMEVFRKSSAPAKLDIPAHAHVIIYSGSIGTWYLTRQMIDCMISWKKTIPELVFLVLTRDREKLTEVLSAYSAGEISFIRSTSASYEEMPAYLSLARSAIFFIKPAYSKIASSPTKMAECWAMDLPVITNSGIGDNDRFFAQFKGGVLLKDLTEAEFKRSCSEYIDLLKSKRDYRKIAQEHFSLDLATQAYVSIYKKLIP